MAGKKQDTRLEAEGAEFLVCAHLLIEGIPTYKTYTQMPGYDLVAINPERKTSARIQVKSRYALKAYKAFMLKNTDADFVVLVMLNRQSKEKPKLLKKANPEIFVFPMAAVLPYRIEDTWNKVMIGRIENCDDYRENWDQIRDFLDPMSKIK